MTIVYWVTVRMSTMTATLASFWLRRVRGELSWVMLG